MKKVLIYPPIKFYHFFKHRIDTFSCHSQMNSNVFFKEVEAPCSTVKKIKNILIWQREIFQSRNKVNVSALIFCFFLRTTIRQVTVITVIPCFFPMFILFLIRNLFGVFSQVHVYIPVFHYCF